MATEELFARLKAIDPATLTDVVRQDQRSPSFEVTEWTVQRLSEKGIRNPDGLWLFSGEGHDSCGPRAWSVVLKRFYRPEYVAPPGDLRYWKRELMLAQSGLLEGLPEGVRAPRFYRVEQTPDGAWLWMEHVKTHRADVWELDDYTFAARQLGYWNGKLAVSKPLPTQPWLTRQHYRSWLTGVDLEQIWQFSLHQKHLSPDMRRRLEQLWAERELFYDVLEALPQTFSHFDSQRRNLFIRQGNEGSDELVLIDWAQCGLGPLGAELNWLVGMSVTLAEWPPTGLSQLEATTFAGYLDGLSDAGWSGEVASVRLGYVAALALYSGVGSLKPLAWWSSPEARSLALQQFGMAEEALYLHFMPLLFYSLDCADEARQLMKKLGMP